MPLYKVSFSIADDIGRLADASVLIDSNTIIDEPVAKKYIERDILGDGQKAWDIVIAKPCVINEGYFLSVIEGQNNE